MSYLVNCEALHGGEGWVLWNLLSKAVPGKFRGSSGYSKCNCLQDRDNFTGLGHDKLPLFAGISCQPIAIKKYFPWSVEHVQRIIIFTSWHIIPCDYHQHPELHNCTRTLDACGESSWKVDQYGYSVNGVSNSSIRKIHLSFASVCVNSYPLYIELINKTIGKTMVVCFKLYSGWILYAYARRLCDLNINTNLHTSWKQTEHARIVCILNMIAWQISNTHG